MQLSIKIIDDSNDADFGYYLDLVLDEALKDTNPNSQNLKHLTVKNYLIRHIALDTIHNKPMAVAAIEDYSRGDVKCARVLTRSYYMKDYRHKSLERKIVSREIVRELLPMQMAFLERNEYDLGFVSMETIQKRRVLKSWIEAVNVWYPQWILLDDFYYTCRKHSLEFDVRCWQNIALFQFHIKEFPLASMSVIEYLKRIKNEQ